MFWKVLGTRVFVPGEGRRGQRARELLLFWLVFSIYVPIFTAAALKRSTTYALGKRPRGRFMMPTPK